MYVTPNITGIWEIITNPLEHSCFGSTTWADHSQMTSRMIADIVKNRLRELKKQEVWLNKSLPQYNRVIINYGDEENWQLQTYLVVGRGHTKFFHLC
jgi:hypothetical protein